LECGGRCKPGSRLRCVYECDPHRTWAKFIHFGNSYNPLLSPRVACLLRCQAEFSVADASNALAVVAKVGAGKMHGPTAWVSLLVNVRCRVAPIHSFIPPLTVKVWVGADGWGSVVRVSIRVQVGDGSHGGDERGHGERSHCEATQDSRAHVCVSSCANHMVYRLLLKSYFRADRDSVKTAKTCAPHKRRRYYVCAYVFNARSALIF
jgi:hypothetical protein